MTDLNADRRSAAFLLCMTCVIFFSPNARKGERRGAGGKRKIDARGDVGGRRAEGVKTEDERIR